MIAGVQRPRRAPEVNPEVTQRRARVSRARPRTPMTPTMRTPTMRTLTTTSNLDSRDDEDSDEESEEENGKAPVDFSSDGEAEFFNEHEDILD